MELALPLDQMTVDEKLRAIEMIWDDLARNAAGVPVPAWHRDEVEARLERLDQGQEEVMDLAEAKRRIAESIR